MLNNYPHRTYFINSDMIDTRSKESTKFKKIIHLSQFEEDYTDVSLKDAVIPNSFPTIQEETNDRFNFIISIEVNPDVENSAQFSRTTISKDVYIPEGFYTQDQLINIMNNTLKDIKYSDFDPKGEFITEEQRNSKLFLEEENLFQIDDKDDNQTYHLELKGGTNVLYQPVVNSDKISYPICWLSRLVIVTYGLSYKYFGINSNGFYECYCHEHGTAFKPGMLKGNKLEVVKTFLPDVMLPNRPSLIWVSAINIRMDIVNIDQDSQVLDTIPVPDHSKEFIVYQNYDTFNTSKKFNNTYNNGQIEIHLTQQNGYELNLDNIEFCFNIIVFKKN